MKRRKTRQKPKVCSPKPLSDTEQAMSGDPQPDTRLCQGSGVWHGQYETVVGLRHRDALLPLPCQDAALAITQPRPVLLVADGAGSAAVSEIGSQAVVTGLARLISTLEQQLVTLLDSPVAASPEASRSFGLVMVKHAKGLLADLAQTHRRPQKDFRCTLLAIVAGKHHLMWLKIGDGAIVVEQIESVCSNDQTDNRLLQPRLQTLGKDGKGEFANQTTFIDEKLTLDDVQTGGLPIHDITGMALMSDGGAERLVSNDGSKVATQISGWLDSLRQGKLKRRVLTQRFYTEEFTQGTSGDDCGIALCSVELASPPQ